jgi:MoaD family protein
LEAALRRKASNGSVMRVKIRFYASLREFVGLEELELEVSEGSTLRDLLGKLTERFGPRFEEVRTKDPFEAYVRGDGSNPAIILNGRTIDPEQGLGVKLREGDLVVIMPLMASG